MSKASKIIISILLVIAIAAGGGLSYLYLVGYSGIDHHKKAEEGQIKVACVGDSNTYGHGITPWFLYNYPKVLGDLLGDGYVVNNYGHHGATCQSTGDQPYISYNDYKNSIKFKADILIFMLGSNDAKTENWRGEEAFEAEYIARLNEYKESNPDMIIYLCTPPTSYRKNSENPARVEIIADIVRAIAAEEGYALIDVNDFTENREDIYIEDGAHLSKEGAAELARLIFSALCDE